MARSVLINILGNPASALAALEEVGIKAQETAKKTAGVGESSDASMSKFASLGKYAAASVVVAGVAAVDMGAKLQEAHRNLAVAVQDTGTSFDKILPSITKADKAMESLGFTNQQTEEALAVGTTATKSSQKALDYLSIAADLARYKHIALSDAMLLVVKGGEGMLRPLRALGIDLPVAAGNALQVEKAQASLAKAEVALQKAQEALHPSAAQMAADQLSAQKAALALQRANDAVTLAQQNYNAVLAKYPGAAHESGIGAQKVADALAKLKLAQESARIAAENHGKVFSATGPQAKYEAALQKVADAQAKVTSVSSTGNMMINELRTRLAGQASDAATTFSGRMEVMRARLEDVGARIGQALIPWLEKLMSAISQLVDWFDKHRTAAIALAAVIGTVLVGATIAWVAALSPVELTILSVVVAVTALIAIGTALYQNWDKVLGFLRSGFGTLVQVILLGPFAIISLLALHWREVWDGMQITVQAFVNFFGGIVGWFASLPSKIVGFFSGVGDGIASFFEQIPSRIWNNVILPIWNFFVTLPGSIVKLFEHLGSDIVHTITSNIPGSGIIGNAISAIGGIFEEGGFVPGSGPQLAIVHGGEYVLTQQDVAGLQHPGGAGRFSAAGAGGGAGGDLVIQIDGREFGRVAGPSIRTWLLQEPRRNATRVIG